MRRNKKLLRNTIAILAILFSYYYFYGYYVSKDQCIEDTMRSLYVTGTERIMEFENDHLIVTLVADKTDKTFSLISTKKIGFLYHSGSCLTNTTYEGEEMLDVNGMYNKEMGMTIVAYRNTPSISYIEVSYENGQTIILNEWKDNFVGIMFDSDEWIRGTYKAYDINHQLIDEVYY